MTLIAARISDERIELLADGLSCHKNLTITPQRHFGSENVLTEVPGRTTLQKIFPHPHLPLAIAHCGNNQRKGIPVGKIIDEFWSCAISGNVALEAVPQRFEDEFGNAGTAETFWLIGFEVTGAPLLRVIGKDCARLDGNRHWCGSGRDGLSSCWRDLESLRDAGKQYLADCQKHAPCSLPCFANSFGGYWHRLQITPRKVPEWVDKPLRKGVKVSSLFPTPPVQVPSDNPTHLIKTRGEELKAVLRQKFNKRVRGSLKCVSSEDLRERLARLIAIFDEVELDPRVATQEDSQRYAGAVEEVISELDAG